MQEWLRRYGLNRVALPQAVLTLSMLTMIAAGCAAILLGGLYVLVAHFLGTQ
jgi:hypothetical protein